MSESRTDTGAAGPSEGRSEHDRDHEEFQAGTGYQPSTNQARDEPVPASHHDQGRQEAGRRPGEPVRDDPADSDRPDRADSDRADSDRADSDRADSGQTGGGQADGGKTGRGPASHDETGQDG
jgi:segregation and condensation protein B